MTLAVTVSQITEYGHAKDTSNNAVFFILLSPDTLFILDIIYNEANYDYTIIIQYSIIYRSYLLAK